MPASVLSWAAIATLVLYVLGLAGIVATGARADELPYGPPTAYAEPEPEGKPCPVAPGPLAEPPPPSEGEEPAPDPDAVQRELRSQRIEATEICEAQTSSARELQRRLWWAVAEMEPLSGTLETANERTVELVNSQVSNNGEFPELLQILKGNACAEGGEGCEDHLRVPVQVAGDFGGGGMTEAQMLELVSSIDASGEASQGALYFLAGLLVSLFLGYCFWRTVLSGT